MDKGKKERSPFQLEVYGERPRYNQGRELAWCPLAGRWQTQIHAWTAQPQTLRWEPGCRRAAPARAACGDKAWSCVPCQTAFYSPPLLVGHVPPSALDSGDADTQSKSPQSRVMDPTRALVTQGDTGSRGVCEREGAPREDCWRGVPPGGARGGGKGACGHPALRSPGAPRV